MLVLVFFGGVVVGILIGMMLFALLSMSGGRDGDQ
jgi:hypothetical protein